MEKKILDGLLEAALCPRKALAKINIAVDELFGNIAHYAHNPKTGRQWCGSTDVFNITGFSDMLAIENAKE